MKALRKTSLFFLLLFPLCSLKAQVDLCVDQVPDFYTPLLDGIFVAGNFNSWMPGDSSYRLQKVGNCWEVSVPGNPGDTLEFKFTRGDWSSVETQNNGAFLPNRVWAVANGAATTMQVAAWDDLPFNGSAVGHTYILDMDFAIPQLGRERRIWLWLPPDYYAGLDSYAVVYMHDGQNLFDPATSFAGEWGIDESMEALSDSGYPSAIIVGIDNGAQFRVDEYSPWVHPSYGGGQGDSYMQFLIHTLKPYIDQYYRTRKDRQHTAMIGSSLGGLISFYGGIKYQETFSKLGLFSPSYWFAGQVWGFPGMEGHRLPMRIYQVAGALEGQSMVPDMWAMQDSLLAAGWPTSELLSVAKSDGEHKEWFWKREFPPAYKWLFAEQSTSRSDMNTPAQIRVWADTMEERVYVELPSVLKGKPDLEVYNIRGQAVLKKKNWQVSSFAVGSWQVGYYYILMRQEEKQWYGRFFLRGQP